MSLSAWCIWSFADAVFLADRAQAGQLASDGLPLAVGQVQQVLAAAHQIHERPVEKRLVEIVGAAAAPLVLPDEFAVLAGEVIEEGLHRLVQGVEETTLPHGPVGRRVERDIGGQAFHAVALLSSCGGVAASARVILGR